MKIGLFWKAFPILFILSSVELNLELIYTHCMKSKKYQMNMPMLIAGLIYFVLFALLIISKRFLPDAGGGWSDPPIFDYLFLLGMGICFSILGIGYTYYSWTLNEEDYLEWFADQQLFGTYFTKMYRRTRNYWTTRISAPIGALMGIALSILMLIAIFAYFYR